MGESLVVAFADDTIFSFERAQERTGSWFGGPMCREVSGLTAGPAPLHRIAHLAATHLPALRRFGWFELPLVYGLRYDGCELRYRVLGCDRIELVRLVPALSSEDWPYPNYPALLPFLPLRLAEPPRASDWETFASAFPNLAEQQSAELVVAVPAPAAIGVSLWGCGDDEGVTIVFECDSQDRLVFAGNVTT